MTHWKCGSVACAMGHAASIPEFRDLGFHLVFETSTRGRYAMPNLLTESGNICTGMDAVMYLLGISYSDACYLFTDESYPSDPLPTPKDVAKRIRGFIETPIDTSEYA